MDRRNFQVPNLKRDLAWIAASILLVAMTIGAAIGAVIDMLIHRHRSAR